VVFQGRTMVVGGKGVGGNSRFSRRVGAVMSCIAVAGLAAGCGSAGSGSAGGAAGATGGTKTIGISAANATWPWYTTFDNVIQKQFEDKGWKVILLSGEADPVKQADTISQLTSRNVDLLIVGPVDGKAIVPAVRAASRAHIRVLMTADSIADEGLQYVTAQAVADNCGEAKLAAKAMADAIKGDGDVITLEGLPGQPATVARTSCFKDELASVAPRLHIVATQNFDWDPVKAQSVAQDLLTSHPNVAGMWVEDDNSAAAVCDVLTKKNVKPVMVSTGGSKNGIAAVKSGCLKATVSQSPTAGAEQTADIAEKILAGQNVPKTNIAPMPVITADNAGQYPGDW
jgi:ribose transport system substrate-binding protein